MGDGDDIRLLISQLEAEKEAYEYSTRKCDELERLLKVADEAAARQRRVEEGLRATLRFLESEIDTWKRAWFAEHEALRQLRGSDR